MQPCSWTFQNHCLPIPIPHIDAVIGPLKSILTSGDKKAANDMRENVLEPLEGCCFDIQCKQENIEPVDYTEDLRMARRRESVARQ